MTNSPGPTVRTRYRKACSEFGAALERLARGYEADTDKRRDGGAARKVDQYAARKVIQPEGGSFYVLLI